MAGCGLGYKALLQVGAIFLAFGTRKESIKGLNDSQYIATTIYVTSLFLTAIIVLSVTISDFVNLYAGLIGRRILITTTTTLRLVFVPKVLLQDFYSPIMHIDLVSKIAYTCNEMSRMRQYLILGGLGVKNSGHMTRMYLIT